MKMLMHGEMSLELLLIALGIGYLVCTQARKEAKALKTLGYIIGAGLIAIAAVLIATKVIWFCGYSKMCPLKSMLMQKGMMQEQMLMPKK